jgi:hypothetical protein
MNHIRSITLVLAIGLFSGCASAPKTAEVKEISDWKLVFNHNLANGGLVRHFIPAGEKVDTWSQRFNVTFNKHNPAAAKQSLRAQADEVCARNTREVSVQLKNAGKPDCQVKCGFITTSDASLVFEIPQTCSASNSNYQLLRWIAAPEGMYYFSFLQKQAVTPDTRSKWLAIMNATRPAKGEHIRDYFD